MEQPNVSVEEIMKQQGTRLDETPPWMSYAAELEEKLSPELEAAVEEYSQRRYDEDRTSSQNKEELCRQREINEDVAKQYQWIHPSEYADEGPRIGRVMTHEEFIGKLRQHCKEHQWFYRDHPQPRKVTLLYSDPYANQEPQVACWAQAGFMPEYSFMRFDDHGVPLDERRRGWRTCLLQLILKGLVTEETATKVFGAATGPASERFNSLLYEWRNRRVEVV